MIEINTLEELLMKSKKFLQEQYGIEKIGYSGSYARNEQRQTSDLDIIIELGRPIGLEFLDIKYYLKEKLGVPIDLVTTNALKPQLKKQILSEVVYQ